jgi:hypothetical protein
LLCGHAGFCVVVMARIGEVRFSYTPAAAEALEHRPKPVIAIQCLIPKGAHPAIDAPMVDFGCPGVDCQVSTPLCFPAVKNGLILE